jgi:acyl-coenzyme A synthetase/AMP-(fatty) acid ligase
MIYNFLVKKILKNKNSNKIIFQDKYRSISWKNLYLISSYNAQLLKKKKCKNILIICDRKINTPIAIISTILAGKTFCPISNKTPKFRIKYMLNMLKTDVLINFGNIKLDQSLRTKEIKLNLKKKDLKNNFEVSESNNNDICYVLFTSGSTGQPKGVILNYNNLLNTILWSKNYLKWTRSDKIGVATNFSFDISMFDLLSSIYFNTTAYIFSNPQNPILTLKEINKYSITSIFSVPSFFSNFVYYNLINKKFNKLKRIISGGDFLLPKIISEWKKNHKTIDIFNVWGPTETSIVNSMHLIRKNELKIIEKKMQVPIGKSTQRMKIKIYHNKKLTSKPYTKGEITLCGKCVSQGYIGDIENKKKYIQINNERAFLTGDIGYFNRKKQLFIVGRNDTVVKISGYRIDLKDIEKTSLKIPTVSDAKAILKSYQDLKYINLFIQTNNNRLQKNFRKNLSELLPDYSMPKKIFFLKKFPKTLNDKIDLKKLSLNY